MANFNSQFDTARVTREKGPSKGFIVLVDSESAG